MSIFSSLLEGLFAVFNTIFQNVVNVLVQDPRNYNGTLYDMARNLCDGFCAVGISLLILFFFMGLIQAGGSMADLKRPEVVARELVRLVICEQIMVNSFKFMQLILEAGGSIILTGYNEASAYTGTAGALQMDSTVKDTLGNVGFSITSIGVDSIVTLLVGVIFVIALGVTCVYLYLIIYGRLFKLYMYMAIAPIPLSTFGCRSTSDIGKHFIKSYCGVLLQGLIIMLALLIFIVFFQSPESPDTGDGAAMMLIKYSINILIRLFTLIATIKASDQIVYKMLGI